MSPFRYAVFKPRFQEKSVIPGRQYVIVAFMRHQSADSSANGRKALFRTAVIAGILLAGGITASQAWAGRSARATEAADQPASDPGSIIVRFKDEVNLRKQDGAAAALGGAVQRRSRFTPALCSVSIPAGSDVQRAIAQYRQRADVVYAEPNYLDVPFEAPAFTPDDPLFFQQWNFEMIHMPAAWEYLPSRGTSSVIVAIVDTGVAYENYDVYRQAPDLAGVNFVSPYDAVDYDGHPVDDNGHGTHVCGTIAQATHNGLGVAGMADHVSIMPVRSLGTGGGSHLQFSDAVHWAVDNGARIINYSGGGSDSTTKHDAVIYAYTHGVLLIAAYGNNSASNPASAYPARYAEAMGVGAIDRAKDLAWYSNWGDGVDVVAPGGDTSASATNGVIQNTFETTVTNFNYVGWQGTSMATPHVSGLAALLWSQGIFTNRQDVFDRIIQTCEDLGETGYDPVFGWGLIDAQAALLPRPSAPTGVSASDGTFDDKVRIAWEPAPNASGYVIYRNTIEDTNTAVAIGGSTATNYDDVSSGMSVTSFYWIAATNAFCAGPWSAPDTGYRAPAAPFVIAQPQAQTGNPGESVSFSVTASGTAPLYYQWRKNGVNLGIAATSAYTIGAIAKSDEGAYLCVVSNAAGSTNSAPALLTVKDPLESLPAPAGVAASDGTFTNKVRVTWNPVTNAASYEVWRHTTTNSGLAHKAGNASAPSYDDASAAAFGNTSLYYWVKSKNADGVSVFSYPDMGYCGLGTNLSAGSADLALNSLLFLPAALDAGAHPDLAAAVLMNNGPDDMTVSNKRISLDFYLATNSAAVPGLWRWIGEYGADAALAAGSHTTLILPAEALNAISIPADGAGAYYVMARVRHAAPSTLADPNPSNNTAARWGAIAVGEAGTERAVAADFDGDGKTDPALYQETTGNWSVKLSAGHYGLAVLCGFGGDGFVPIPNDYDGDGKADPAVYDPVAATLYVRLSGHDYAQASFAFGGYGYQPVSGDYDGGGQADLALYQEATCSWLALLTKSLTLAHLSFGADGAQPLAGDYDGDRKADPGLYQEASGHWSVKCSGSSYAPAGATFGGAGYAPVAGDYDGDRKADPLVYGESGGTWMAMLSAGGYTIAGVEGFGGPGYAPAPGDYDGDGRSDLALYQASTRTWFFKLSASGYGLIAYPF